MSERRHCIARPIPPRLLLSLLLGGFTLANAAEFPAASTIGRRLLDDLKRDDWILQAAALNRLGDMKHADATGPVLDILQTGSNAWIRGQALIALARIAPHEVPSRAGPLLGAPEVETRLQALRALEYSRQPAALAAVKAAVADTNSLVRWSARAARAAIEGAGAWDDIDGALKSATAPEEAEAIREIARALAYIGSENSLDRIDPLLERHHAAGRAPHLIRGLADVHDAQLIPRLVHVRRVVHDDPASVSLCRKALGQYTGAELSAALSAIFATSSNDLAAAARTAGELCPSPEMGELLAGRIANHAAMEPAVLRDFLDALAVPAMAPSRHQALFVTHLGFPDPGVRQAAVRGLEHVENADLFALLAPALRDESTAVRKTALAAVASVPQSKAPPDVAAYLQEFLRSEDFELYEQGLKVLAVYARSEHLTSVLDVLGKDLGGADAARRNAAARAITDFCGIERMFEIAGPQGFVVDWMVLGVFPSDRDNVGFAEKFPPEESIDFDRAYRAKYAWTGEGAGHDKLQDREIRWQRSSLVMADGKLSLMYLMPPARYGVCYAVADLRSEQARTVRVTVAADNCAAIWLNGKELARLEPSEQGGATSVTRELPMALAAGVNRLMVKVAKLGGEWWTSVRLHDDEGAAVVLPSAFPPVKGVTP